MARHTAWRTGGTVDAWVVAHGVDAVDRMVADCAKAKWQWRPVGACTRTVWGERAPHGVVVRLGVGFQGVERIDDGGVWRVGAAVPMPALATTVASAGFGGADRFVDAIGTVGASLALDDGWDAHVIDVDFLARGKRRTGTLAEARSSRVVLGARLRWNRETTDRATARLRAAWAKALPGRWVSAPAKRSVRTVVRQTTLERVRLRAAAIPPEAPEMLVNLGGATPADLQLLHKSVIERVARLRGLDLSPHIRFT